MKKLTAITLVLFLVLSLVACGSNGLIRAPDGGSATQSITPGSSQESNDVPETPNNVEYPGKLSIDSVWETEGAKGYMFEEQMRLWEPERSQTEYVHPTGSNQIIPMYGDDVWVIPFEKSLKNITVGFGSAPFNHLLGVFSLETGEKDYSLPSYAFISPSSNITSDDVEYYTKNGLAYFETAVFSASALIMSYPNGGLSSAEDATLAEGSSIILTGFYLFHEPAKTPNNPTETDDSYFWSSSYTYQTVYSMKVLFAGVSSTSRGSERAVAFIRKTNSGELVLTTSTSQGNSGTIIRNEIPQAPLVGTSPRLVDDTELLTTEQKNNLLSRLDLVSKRQHCDVVLVTVPSIGNQSPRAFADDYYDYNGYGYDENHDGILLLLSMEERDWAISTCGFGITAFTDDGLSYIFEQIKGDLGRDDYYTAFDKYIDLCDEFLTTAHSNESVIATSTNQGNSDTATPKMPNLVSTDYREAKNEMMRIEETNSDLRLYLSVVLLPELSADTKKDLVISTIPAAGEPLARNMTIYITYSMGFDSRLVEVPNLVGLSLAAAKHELERRNLTVGNIKYFEDEVPIDTVIFNTQRGDIVAEYTVIDLQVSSGPTRT